MMWQQMIISIIKLFLNIPNYKDNFKMCYSLQNNQLTYFFDYIILIMEASPPKQSKNNNLQKQTKDKGQEQPQEDKANSVFIARQLINGDIGQIPKRLLQFKNIKNQNYQKFSQRIKQNLAKSNLSFSESRQIFSQICYAASDENTTGHQMGSILQGFSRYWASCEIGFEQMRFLFNFINEVYAHVSKKYISVCRELIDINCTQDFATFKEEAIKLVNKYYKGSKTEEDKVLPLIYSFDLYDAVGSNKVVEVAMRYVNAGEIAYIFKQQENIRKGLVKLYIDKCVKRQSRDDLKKCQTIIKNLKLNPFDYQNMIEKMIDKYLYYQLRSNKLFFIELVVCYDQLLVEGLVYLLIRQKRHRQAKYFIIQYHLEMQKFYPSITQNQRQEIRKIRNILIDNDKFGPTQIQVLEQEPPEQSYLYLKDLGFSEKDITFVDQSNIHHIDVQAAFTHKKIGLDSQTSGGVHVFDTPQITILQIFTGSHFFIFDYLHLIHNDKFKTILIYLFTNCKIYGHDHQKQITSIQKQMNLEIQQKVMQQLQRNRLLDTSKYFKKIFPKQTKSSLVYITQYLLKCSISKYEQCSGWRNRPLRKAQVHYACIDCILPVVLGEKLQLLENNTKKKA